MLQNVISEFSNNRTFGLKKLQKVRIPNIVAELAHGQKFGRCTNRSEYQNEVLDFDFMVRISLKYETFLKIRSLAKIYFLRNFPIDMP